MIKKLFITLIILMIPLTGFAAGTPFTSVGTGDWDDGATWGNDSPGIKGTDWPGTAGDVFTVDTGHTVTYNVSETNELGGTCELNGKLTFDDSGNRKITFGDEYLSINNGGELEIGTSGSPFSASFVAEFIFNPTSDHYGGSISIDNGGKFTTYGSPTYRTVYSDTLADSAENTDSDAVIETVTDMSADWQVGDELTFKVEDNGDSTVEDDAIKIGIIQSFDGGNGKLITLDISPVIDAAVGDTWLSPVNNVERNIKIYKLGASTAINNNNTNRPRIYYLGSNDSGVNGIMSYTQLTGFYTIDASFDFQLLNSVVRNGYYGTEGGVDWVITNSWLYSLEYGVYNPVSITSITGEIYACHFGFRNVQNQTLDMDMYSCDLAFYTTCDNNTFNGDYFGNNNCIYDTDNCIMNGDLRWNSSGITNGSGITFNGDASYNNNALSNCDGATVTGGDFINNYNCFSGDSLTVSDVNIDGSFYGFTTCDGVIATNVNIYNSTSSAIWNCKNFKMIGGKLGYTAGDVSDPNTLDVKGALTGNCMVSLVGTKMPLAGMGISTNVDNTFLIAYSENDDDNILGNAIYQNMGNSIKVACDGAGDAPSIDPDGGTDYCVELSSIQSGCDSKTSHKVIAWGPTNYRIWTAASATTYTFPIQTTYAGIAEGGLTLTARYLDTVADSSSFATEVDDTAIDVRTADTDWTESLSVTFTPAQAGWVYITIDLTEYQASDEVWIWPIPTELSATHESVWLAEGAGLIETASGGAGPAATTAYGHF